MSNKPLPRSRHRRVLAIFALATLATALALYGCVELEQIDVNVCGNRVVEEGNQEDCDGDQEIDGRVYTCGEEYTQNACRFLCQNGEECPPKLGYGCGADGVCRRAGGTFGLFSTKSTATALDLMAGDTNADGCHELVSTTVHGTTVTGFDSRRQGFCAASSQVVPGHPGTMEDPLTASPLITELSGNARPELVLSGSNPLGDGLRVLSSDATGSTTLVSLLYPTEGLAEPGVRMLKVKVPADDMGMGMMQGGAPPTRDAVLLFLGEALVEPGAASPKCEMMMPDGGTMMPDGGPPPPPDGGPPPPGPTTGQSRPVRVALVDRPEIKAIELESDLGGKLNEIVALTAADLDGDGCDEVLIGRADTNVIEVYRICEPQVTGKYVFQPLVTVTLDGGAKLRKRNASIVVAQLEGDDHLDIIANANDCQVHVARGNGQGSFNSVQGPFTVGDERTGVYVDNDEGIQMGLLNTDGIIVAGDFVRDKPGLELASVVCPPGESFASDLCPAVARGCEARVADLDRDGLDDIVTTQGQQVGLIVGRAAESMGFHIAMLDTECPPHDLAVGDFDDDGINDVAFLDQAAVSGGAATAVKIAYGRPYAQPEAPRIAGFFDHAMGLVSGEFTRTNPMEELIAPTKLFAARNFGEDAGVTSGIGMLGGNSERQTLAPFYLPKPSTSDANALAEMEIFAVAEGRFAFGADEQPARALAVIARESGKGLELWLVRWDPATGTLVANRSEKVKDLTCKGPALVDNNGAAFNGGCVLASANADVAKGPDVAKDLDELLLFQERTLIVYGVTPDGFVERTNESTGTHQFLSIDGSPPPGRFVPRPLVADLDGDGKLDVVVRDQDGVMVAFWGKGDGSFTQAAEPLFDAPKPKDCAPNCAKQTIALLREGLDAATKQLSAKQILRVGPGVLEVHQVIDRKPRPVVVLPALGADAGSAAETLLALQASRPRPETDFVAVAAADFDGDGVDDVAIMPSGSSIHVFRGIPEHE